MRFHLGLLSLATAVSAAGPLLHRQEQTVFNTYEAQAELPSNPQINGRLINANGSKFFINKASSAYCPPGVPGLDCRLFGTNTVIQLLAETKKLALATSVPGGQQIYVDSDGALRYTMPHSGAVPNGSLFQEFSATQQNGLSDLIFQGAGFTACPTDNFEIFQVYALGSPGFQRVDCQPFTVALINNPPSAYQY